MRAHLARHEGDFAAGQGPGPVELVGGEQNCPAFGAGGRQEAVQQIAPGGIKAGMGFVEEEESGPTSQDNGQRRAPLLTGGQAAEGDTGQALETELLHGRGRIGNIGATGPGEEPEVLGHGEVVVAARRVAQEGEMATDLLAIPGQIEAEHLTGAGGQGDEPGQEAQQRCLAGAVGPGEEHDLALLHVKINPGQGRKPAQQADGGSQTYGGRGHDRSSVRTATRGVGAPRLEEPGCRGPGGRRSRRSTEPPVASTVVDRFRALLSATGAVLTSTGVLILLFVAYQLWGTGLYTARAQDDLKSDFRKKLAAAPAAPSPADPSPSERTGTTVAPPPPPTGDEVAIIRIPKVGIDHAVVQGVSLADLRRGPGHYPSTPLPGETGNAGIAGHRTTYGAPFNRLDELTAGDEVLVTTLRGSYRYLVKELKVVKPSQVEVLDPTPEPTLTLTTCNPKYSAKERLIVVTTLAPGETAAPATAPLPEDAAPVELADAGLASGHSKAKTLFWGVITALVAFAWWLTVRRRRRWTSYVGGVIPFLVVLFFFYANLELLLPANF